MCGLEYLLGRGEKGEQKIGTCYGSQNSERNLSINGGKRFVAEKRASLRDSDR